MIIINSFISAIKEFVFGDIRRAKIG